MVLNLPPENKPWNVAHNIFSELPQNASLLFFRKKINEIYKWKILRDNGKLKPNFVKNLQRQFSAEKLCVIFKTENQTLWKTFKDNSRIFSNIKTILNEKLCGKLKTEPNFVDKRCVEFFSSWKYNTVCNIGLFQVASFVIFLTRRC